jgi:hypothetical protein
MRRLATRLLALAVTTLLKPTECVQNSIETNIKTIATYLVKERALEVVQAAIGQVSNAYK